MPRTARVQFEGARYHVINRGNYRKDLFLTRKTSDAFSEVLFKACDRFRWKLHAYVLMSNHYHLCLETPQADLGDGMHWLQSTFANKFSRFTGERGHVFQGRYKSLVIEGDYGLLGVVDYIHLNPVRAQVVTVDQLKEYPNSSFPKYFNKYRPSCLENGTFLHEAGGLKPTPAGMRAYHKRLKLIMAESPMEREAAFKDLSRGWYIGSREGRQRLARQIQTGTAQSNAETKIRLQSIHLEDQLQDCLKQLGKTSKDVETDPKSAPWKLAIASYLKSTTGVKNPRLCALLNLGHPATMSNHVSIYNQTKRKKCAHYAKLPIQNN